MNQVAVPSWLISTVLAFGAGYETGLIMVLGLLGQWLVKAQARIPKGWDATIVLAVGLGFYTLLHAPYITFTSEQWREWGIEAFKWTFAALGVASFAGRTGGAPATDSKVSANGGTK